MAYDPDELVTPEWVSGQTKIPLATLYRWRHFGTGPRVYKIGRHLRYRRGDVEKWIESQRVKVQ
jgi:predicted DNA-binding transcriptional regulator AlpA